jgi:hypothetical protein
MLCLLEMKPVGLLLTHGRNINDAYKRVKHTVLDASAPLPEKIGGTYRWVEEKFVRTLKAENPFEVFEVFFESFYLVLTLLFPSFRFCFLFGLIH